MKSEYDNLYKKYDKAIVRSFKNYDEILEKVSDILKNKGEILDFGAGTGELALKICRKNNNAKITGIDASKKMIEIANEKIKKNGFQKKVRFVCADKISGNKKYDAIASTFVLYLIDREKMMGAFSMHLKKNGVLVLTDLVFQNPWEEFVAYCVRIFQKTHFLPVANFCRKEYLNKLIEKEGFNQVNFEKVGHFFTLPVYLITAVKK